MYLKKLLKWVLKLLSINFIDFSSCYNSVIHFYFYFLGFTEGILNIRTKINEIKNYKLENIDIKLNNWGWN